MNCPSCCPTNIYNTSSVVQPSQPALRRAGCMCCAPRVAVLEQVLPALISVAPPTFLTIVVRPTRCFRTTYIHLTYTTSREDGRAVPASIPYLQTTIAQYKIMERTANVSMSTSVVDGGRHRRSANCK